jgi:hypothetical protein
MTGVSSPRPTARIAAGLTAGAAGLLSAILLTAGCGGGGGSEVAANVSTAAAGATATRTGGGITAKRVADNVTQTVEQTTTESQTATVQQTVQQSVTQTPPAVTTTPQAVPTTAAATADGGGDTSTLAWVVVGLVIAAAIGLGIAFVVRSKKNVENIPSEERLQRLFSTVSMWTVQGWVVEREDETSAILSRDGELMRVAVDGRGNIRSSKLAAGGVGPVA